MTGEDLAAAIFMPLVYLLSAWILDWLLVMFFQVPPESAHLISIYAALSECIVCERAVVAQKQKGR